MAIVSRSKAQALIPEQVAGRAAKQATKKVSAVHKKDVDTSRQLKKMRGK